MASNCCYRGASGRPQVVCFGLFDQKVVCCGVFHCIASSSSIIPFVATKQHCRSAIRTNTLLVTCKCCYLLSFLGPPWYQWPSDWCALGCSAAVAFGCVCSSHVSGWLRLVEVFVAVGVSCFLLCRVGKTLCGPLARWERRQVYSLRHSSRVLEVGRLWHGCACS